MNHPLSQPQPSLCLELVCYAAIVAFAACAGAMALHLCTDLLGQLAQPLLQDSLRSVAER